MKLYDAIQLYERMALRSKSQNHKKWVLGKLGDVSSNRMRPNSLAAVIGNVELASVDLTMLQQWSNALIEQNMRYADDLSSRPAQFGSLSPHTIDGYRRALSTFWRWLVQWHDVTGITADPTAAIQWPDPPRANEEPPKAVLLADLQRVLSMEHLSLRDEAIIRWLASSGARLEETANLTRSKMVLRERYAIVAGKGRGGGMKQRALIFDRPTATAIKRYLNERSEQRITSDWMWLSDAGTPLSADGIAQMLRRRKHDAGLEKFSAHRLRHFWATRAIESGMSESHVQDQLGHEDLRTTRRYAKFLPLQRRDAYDNAFGPEGVVATRSRLPKLKIS